MPHQWCSHPTSHQGATKIGSRPNHPKGDRRIKEELAIYISDKYGLFDSNNERVQNHLFCRTCFERESAEFHQTTESSTRQDVLFIKQNFY